MLDLDEWSNNYACYQKDPAGALQREANYPENQARIYMLLELGQITR